MPTCQKTPRRACDRTTSYEFVVCQNDTNYDGVRVDTNYDGRHEGGIFLCVCHREGGIFLCVLSPCVKIDHL